MPSESRTAAEVPTIRQRIKGSQQVGALREALTSAADQPSLRERLSLGAADGVPAATSLQLRKVPHDIVAYVSSEMRTFRKHRFSEVDSLVFSKLSYLNWLAVPAVPRRTRKGPAPTLRDLFCAECFEGLFDTQLDRDKDVAFLTAVVASPRFRDVRVLNHVNSIDEAADKQFSATTFLLPDKTVYVAFRGTDNTIVGWKEDFDLAFRTPVAAQTSAVAYLERAAAATDGHIRVGGHSKGGNLAVYAAAMAAPAVREHIVRVYSHDGPGFNETALAQIRSSDMAGRVSKSVPESSVVGMLLENQETYHVIRSDAAGIMQHDPYSWIVLDGAFVPMPGVDDSSVLIDRTLSGWISGMDDAHMERFVNALFDVFGASGTKRFQDMSFADYMASAQAVVDMDPDERAMFLRTIEALARVGAQSLADAMGTAAADATDAVIAEES
ncbi:MAG: DUF2974 domain-containing protein [Atopobiaceae bacterium]|nr:DUF2974 domain-containing protein [Atopobiaceae bacterium]